MQTATYVGVLGDSIDTSEITDGTILPADLSFIPVGELIAYGRTAVTATSETEVDSHTFAAAALGAGDTLLVIVRHEDATLNAYSKLEISGTDITTIKTAENSYNGTMLYFVGVHPLTQTKAMASSIKIHDSTIAGAKEVLAISAPSDWITGAWKLALRGYTNTGTHSMQWWVFRLRSA